MLSSTGEHPATTVAGLESNTLADGLFHASTWIAAFAGVMLVSRAMRSGYRPGSLHLLGLMLAGWGLFNLVEGLVDHHILGIHHVRDGDNALTYDLGFLGLGAVLTLAGLVLAARSRGSSIAPGPAAP
jgi:uncharacterized membrane protein